MNSISANLNVMIKASEKASKFLIRYFGEVENLQVSVKGPLDFVTNTDIKVEKILIEELTKSKKNFSILSEETGLIKNKDKQNIIISIIDKGGAMISGQTVLFFLIKRTRYLINNMLPKREAKNGNSWELKSLIADLELYLWLIHSSSLNPKREHETW